MVVYSNVLALFGSCGVVGDFPGQLLSMSSQPMATGGRVYLKKHLGSIDEQEEFVVVSHFDSGCELSETA